VAVVLGAVVIVTLDECSLDHDALRLVLVAWLLLILTQPLLLSQVQRHVPHVYDVSPRLHLLLVLL
jgi:hypothetical protein